MELTDKVLGITMTALRPVLVTACVAARYFARQEDKQTRVNQAVMDVNLILAALNITVPGQPAPTNPPAQQ